MAHIVLLLFVAGEYSYLSDVCCQKAVQDGIAERAGSAGD